MGVTKEIKEVGVDDYVSVNALYGIPVGTAFTMQLQYNYNVKGHFRNDYGVKAHFGTVKPTVDTKEYRIIPAVLTELFYVEPQSEELFVCGYLTNALIQVEVWL